MASFSVSNLIIGATGPKISSLKTRMLVLILERIVGFIKLSPKSQLSPPSSTLAPFIFASSMRLFTSSAALLSIKGPIVVVSF